MKLYKTNIGNIIEQDGKRYLSKIKNFDRFINRPSLFNKLQKEVSSLQPLDNQELTLLSPIGTQEVWAAGVTYLRSKTARMEVYAAERPELFFKSTASRVVGTEGYVRIRKDSTWDVPEPELTLVCNKQGKIVGYSVGNDMSSRSIEGENPLYLPQAKCYDGSAAIGPCIYVPEKPIKKDAYIKMQILRDKKVVFEGQTTINQMKRSHKELVGYLFKEMSFPNGVYLMTGTCVVPDNDFTLQSGDVVEIEIEEIGLLRNIVA
jgi:2-dehydro-3-deoxy-D-arabinonate dehydratase